MSPNARLAKILFTIYTFKYIFCPINSVLQMTFYKMITLVDTVIKNIVSLESGKTNMQAQFILSFFIISCDYSSMVNSLLITFATAYTFKRALVCVWIAAHQITRQLGPKQDLLLVQYLVL